MKQSAVCSQTWPDIVELTDGKYKCITEVPVFKNIIADEDGLQYSRFIHASSIKDSKKRHEYLAKTFGNSLKRYLLYRNFLLFVKKGEPLGKGKRVVLPNCVIQRVRQQFPASEDERYHGFCDPLEEED